MESLYKTLIFCTPYITQIVSPVAYVHEMYLIENYINKYKKYHGTISTDKGYELVWEWWQIHFHKF